jgi:hypothetical protein
MSSDYMTTVVAYDDVATIVTVNLALRDGVDSSGGEELVQVIIKTGDDLRQDALTLQVGPATSTTSAPPGPPPWTWQILLSWPTS